MICLDFGVFIWMIIHCLCMDKLLDSRHWYNLDVMIKWLWVNVDDFGENRDFLKGGNFESWRILDCFVKNIIVSNGNKWLDWHSLVWSLLEERHIDFMGSNWVYSLILAIFWISILFTNASSHTRCWCQFYELDLFPK